MNWNEVFVVNPKPDVTVERVGAGKHRVVLVDGFSPGFQPPAGQEAEHRRRLAAVVKIDDEDADSKHGLGGYHGSVHVTSDGSDVTVYYAVGVYSEGDNGIPAFNQSWKNVVATFYHELNEARTDADVEDVNRTNNDSLLGWYSPAQGQWHLVKQEPASARRQSWSAESAGRSGRASGFCTGRRVAWSCARSGGRGAWARDCGRR